MSGIHESNGNWIQDGVSTRSPWGIPEPVRHLLVDDGQGECLLWCSGSPGRPEQNPQSSRLCRNCRKLARDAIEDGVLDPVRWGDWLR